MIFRYESTMPASTLVPELRAYTIPVTPFEQNCTILVCTRTGRAAISDPGGDLDKIDRALTKLGVQLEKILLTHGHIDHCGEAAIFAQRHDVPIEGPHEEDAFWINQLPEQGKRFGFSRLDAFVPARWLKDGDSVGFGEISLEVKHCSGHTPGHVVFFHRGTKLAIVGDDVQFVPGHGPRSTFGVQRKTNRFVADHLLGKSEH